MKINVFIPTFSRDFKYLNEIVKLYMSGSYIPNKIIISIGLYRDENKLFFDHVEKMYDNIIIIRDYEKLLAAENRNKAKNYDCDVVAFHDSDDYPHPDRLKIINYYFEKYSNIMHLHHNYNRQYLFEDIDMKSIEVETTNNIYDNYFPDGNYKYGSELSKRQRKQSFSLNKFSIAIGVGAYKMEVLRNIEWSSYDFDFMYENIERRGQDYEYFMKTIYKYNMGLFIDAKIYYYN